MSVIAPVVLVRKRRAVTVKAIGARGGRAGKDLPLVDSPTGRKNMCEKHCHSEAHPARVLHFFYTLPIVGREDLQNQGLRNG